MTTILRFKCLQCKHYYRQLRCLAYTNKIPDEIIIGKDKHKVLRGDEEFNFVFEKAED